jgi:hypothetical protein
MIRGAVLHLLNEQPLLADLFALPTATDTGVVCTNLRTLSGKRPVFVDHEASIFYFPYSHIRFVEIHPGAEGAPAAPAGEDAAAAPEAPPAEPEDLEIDEDFLRRVREA